MTEYSIRTAVRGDLDGLVELESLCFPTDRQASRRSIRHSIGSPHQCLRVVERGSQLVGAATLFLHKHSLRIYSVAIHPHDRGLGLGRLLVTDAEAMARTLGKQTLLLEADLSNRALVTWYEHQGFAVGSTLHDYYSVGSHAVRMSRTLEKGP